MHHAEAYKVLGLSPLTDPESVRRRYRDLVKRFHPDLCGAQADPHRLSQIVDAFETIRPSLQAVAYARPRATPAPRSVQRAPVHAPPRPEATPKPAASQVSVAEILRLGRMATQAPHAATRCLALRQLQRSGSRAAAVFVRQALYDSDDQVAREAVRALVRLKNLTAGSATVELFGSLRLSQRVVLLQELAGQPWQEWFREIAIAAYHDGSAALHRAAVQLLQREPASGQ